MHRKTSTRHARHRYPRTALWVAGGLAAATLAWMVVGVPTLVKYPTDLDVSPQYEGTFSLLVDPLTAAPLAEPVVMPLTVDRRIEAIEDESGSSRVVVRETIHQVAGELLDVTQTNQYVMDRSSIENVADDRAFAFDPANVVDRSGSYRLNLPFDTSQSETYDMYKNEIDDTYGLVGDTETPTTDLEGLHLSNFVASVDEARLSDAYLTELNKTVPLPDTMTLDQMKPQLLAAGIDVDALVTALTPVLTPEDAATLSSFAADPIPIEYVMSFDGQAAVEPVTGAEVRVSVSESVGASPVLTSLPALQDVLSHYPGVPEAVTASAALDDLAAAPASPLFEYSYEQTPASVADVADTVTDMRRQVLLAKVWLPLALAAGAVVSLVVGAVVFLRRRPRPIDTTGLEEPHPAPRPDKEEREIVTAGRDTR
jgi:Porin PorA